MNDNKENGLISVEQKTHSTIQKNASVVAGIMWNSNDGSTIKCELFLWQVEIKYPKYMQCRVILWLTFIILTKYIKVWGFKLNILEFTVSCPGFQPAGHTSPCTSVYWKAWTNRSVSSTLRPTGRSFIVIWRNIPLPSIMKSPLSTHFNKSDYNSVRCNGQFIECNKQTDQSQIV